MKPAPTLIDEVYRASFRNELNLGWKSNTEVRRALESARRFILDEPMAAFMADLANESFLKVGLDSPVAERLTDSLRLQARLPHETIWIEYPLRAYQQRANEIRGTVGADPDEVPWREGWLIQQHPGVETAHILHMWTQDKPEDFSRSDPFKLWTFPFAYGWCADDTPLPWQVTFSQKRKADGSPDPRYAPPSSFISGISYYDRPNVTCVRSPLIEDPRSYLTHEYNELLLEWSGVLRRVWAFLATINDIPAVRGPVRQSRGFLARGQIRKFLDHTTIRLNIPARTQTRVLARKLIAIAHRRRHEVRAFWRNDWRNPPKTTCSPHLWEPIGDSADHIECSRCHGRQVYIHKHMRGDASLGFVSHDYSVTHKIK